MDERMFDEDSFHEEVDSEGQAEACVEYLALNEHKFRNQLQEEGLSYEDVEAELKTVWTNLLASCKRVGYTDSITKAKAQRYGVK